MEIKKADSKGRVSGFEPGKYYSVVRGHTGTGFALNQLHEGGYVEPVGEIHGVIHKGETAIPMSGTWEVGGEAQW